jgi:hypothetical protein
LIIDLRNFNIILEQVKNNLHPLIIYTLSM